VRLAIVSLFGLVVVLIVTAILYVANRTEWAAQELALVINQTLATRSDVVLELADIKGNRSHACACSRQDPLSRGSEPTVLEAASMR